MRPNNDRAVAKRNRTTQWLDCTVILMIDPGGAIESTMG
ncbi:hypothetical protein VN12_25915 [Pirellula sp. SH-Sr6A]|nr:hypothetical protein VN12_25915 [Pirellula sp. SH-Sr6A]